MRNGDSLPAGRKLPAQQMLAQGNQRGLVGEDSSQVRAASPVPDSSLTSRMVRPAPARGTACTEKLRPRSVSRMNVKGFC
jgi:hypothetical protein